MVIEIKITGGTMLVDDDVWFRFCMTVDRSVWIDSTGRAQFKQNRKDKYFHRWVMDFPESFIGHLDANPLNNTKDNLYACTRSENQKNLNDGVRSTNKSGHRGVYWNQFKNKWTAFISVEKQMQWLGTFNTKEEAVAIRKKAEEQYGYYAKR
jgi:hypothetical protein